MIELNLQNNNKLKKILIKIKKILINRKKLMLVINSILIHRFKK